MQLTPPRQCLSPGGLPILKVLEPTDYPDENNASEGRCHVPFTIGSQIMETCLIRVDLLYDFVMEGPTTIYSSTGTFFIAGGILGHTWYREGQNTRYPRLLW